MQPEPARLPVPPQNAREFFKAYPGIRGLPGLDDPSTLATGDLFETLRTSSTAVNEQLARLFAHIDSNIQTGLRQFEEKRNQLDITADSLEAEARRNKDLQDMLAELRRAPGSANAPGLAVPASGGAATPATTRDASPAPMFREAPLPPSTRPRGAEPPVFSGQQTKPLERQEAYLNWRSQITYKLAIDRHTFPTAAERIVYVSQRLAGDPLSRVRRHVDGVATHMTSSPDQWPTPWRDYGDLFRYLDPVYVTIDTVARAAREFESLRQGNNTPFADFLSTFVRLADFASRDNRARVEALRQKINVRLQNALVSLVERPGVEEFDAWVRLLQNLTNNLDDRDYRTKTHAPLSATTAWGGDATPGDPMDLDKLGLVNGHICEEERARRRANNLCMFCGKPGHYALACRARAAKGKGNDKEAKKLASGSELKTGDTKAGKE
jgi:hypothetical protein